ncbi:uncharacterized protein LOC113782402 [Coffea eugenioides]|uniref:uncharacterized protein LOC113782402 n=1 Tax=Coffea eugenioides TaxID=49369 RepID=UPI000F607801|nr:uncharacterized protein LOC113782402 [Coffea eugenioides]
MVSLDGESSSVAALNLEPSVLSSMMRQDGVGMDLAVANQSSSVWVLYKSAFTCHTIGESNQHITFGIGSQLLPEEICFSFVHAKCTAQERECLWVELLREKPAVKPWFLVGDFNVILNAEEKRDSLPFRQADRVELAQFMSLAEVGDAGFSGSRYICCNNRQGLARVWKRLDRFLLNSAAMRMENAFIVQHLGRDPSDHAPLLLSAVTRLDGKPMPFRFLNVWTTKPDFLDVIKECWSFSFPGSSLKILAEKLRRAKQALRQWSRSSFGDIFLAIRTAEQKMVEAEIAHDDHPSDGLLMNLHETRARLRNALMVEGEFWRQKARVKWLMDGNRNTAFFHAGLFTKEVGRTASDMLEVIPRVITEHDNNLLMEVPSIHEVRGVIFSMDGDSAAGLDGFTGKLFTVAWEVVAVDVHRAIASFFCGAMLPRSVTATAIVLLPKVQCPQDFTQFRPISLCNFVNKAIFKILSTLLARVFPRIISLQQSGFVPGRQMADNFLLAQELLSDIKKPNRGGNLMLKLDMMKAYDRVSWLFFTQVLWHFGFSETWIDMVWRLISNVWFSVIMNGLPHGLFKSARGLRQGDPISPTLFVIGAEVLSRSLNALAEHRSYRPFKVPSGCPVVTHLAYADDVIIFTNGLKASVQLVKRVVDGYYSLSGQQVNCQKSYFLVHPRLPPQHRAMIRMVTGFSYKSFPIKYLGCPLYIGRRRLTYFADICSAAQWNVQLLNRVLEPELVRQVVKVPRPSSRGTDRMVWALTADGIQLLMGRFSGLAEGMSTQDFLLHAPVVAVASSAYGYATKIWGSGTV